MHVFITGATGFVGASTMETLVDKGFKITATVRSEEKGDYLKKQFPKGDITTVLVKDQLAPNAYDEAMQGANGVIHLASPFHYDITDAKKDMLDPAVKMTLNILKAAKKNASVKRVCILSSFASVVDPTKGGAMRDYTYTSDDWLPLTEDDAIKNKGAAAYLVSKKVAEETAFDFVDKERPQFSISTFCPPMIYGRLLQEITSLQHLNTSTAAIYSFFDQKEVPADQFPVFVNVTDVADALVAALERDSAAGKRYLLFGGGVDNKTIADGIRERYPELKDRIPSRGQHLDTIANLDTTPAQKDLGIKFKDWKQTILEDTVGQILELEKSLK